MTHTHGTNNARIHRPAWDAFIAGTEVAKAQGLYGAGQDILKESFSGNVKGMGPAAAEMEIEELPGEPFLMFAADKTDPGAFNLPLYPIVSVKLLEAELNVSIQAASQGLQRLEKAAVVRDRSGHGRGRIYAAEEVISVLARPFGTDVEVALEGAQNALANSLSDNQ